MNRLRLHGRFVASWCMAWTTLVVVLGMTCSGQAADSRFQGADCPAGQTAVEDIATGKLVCQEADAMDSKSLRRIRPAGKRVPDKPGAPGKTAEPPVPRKARKAGEVTPSDCGLSRWGCEQACQKTYLTSAVESSAHAAQRAKVALGACLRVCAEEFSCPPKEPETPVEKR